MKQVRSTVLLWTRKFKYKAQIYVDNHPVDREFFDTEAEALVWCEKREKELRAMMGER